MNHPFVINLIHINSSLIVFFDYIGTFIFNIYSKHNDFILSLCFIIRKCEQHTGCRLILQKKKQTFIIIKGASPDPEKYVLILYSYIESYFGFKLMV
ncbi:MAG: hypothetical protein Hyperionvirus29_32 [Hyperionvirus sp.]|uniref:Uncharacterized protein n=1 Tax=Hyperionvirus sp. TaxID=2487770 RepID=A0A3G5AGQ5_9VIRU|nr:MAG: hypothetical protein Hyperionvirus29_32 [Hyperionvirus sp.]